MSTLNSLLLGLFSPEARTALVRVREVMLADPGALDTHSREVRVIQENPNGKDPSKERLSLTLGR